MPRHRPGHGSQWSRRHGTRTGSRCSRWTPMAGGRSRTPAGHPKGGPVQGFGRLSWSPDGAEVAFPGIASIFVAKADGGGAHELNIANAERPAFAPYSPTLAFTPFAGREAAIWTIHLDSGG